MYIIHRKVYDVNWEPTLASWESFRLQKSSLISPVEYMFAELSLKAGTARPGFSLYRNTFGTNTLPAETLYQKTGSLNSQPWILTLHHDVRRFSTIPSVSSENHTIRRHNRMPYSKTPQPPSKYLVRLIENPNVVYLILSLHQCENRCSEYATLKRSRFHWRNLNIGIWETLKRDVVCQSCIVKHD